MVIFMMSVQTAARAPLTRLLYVLVVLVSIITAKPLYGQTEADVSFENSNIWSLELLNRDGTPYTEEEAHQYCQQAKCSIIKRVPGLDEFFLVQFPEGIDGPPKQKFIIKRSIENGNKQDVTEVDHSQVWSEKVEQYEMYQRSSIPQSVPGASSGTLYSEKEQKSIMPDGDNNVSQNPNNQILQANSDQSPLPNSINVGNNPNEVPVNNSEDKLYSDKITFPQTSPRVNIGNPPLNINNPADQGNGTIQGVPSDISSDMYVHSQSKRQQAHIMISDRNDTISTNQYSGRKGEIQSSNGTIRSNQKYKLNDTHSIDNSVIPSDGTNNHNNTHNKPHYTLLEGNTSQSRSSIVTHHNSTGKTTPIPQNKPTSNTTTIIPIVTHHNSTGTATPISQNKPTFNTITIIPTATNQNSTATSSTIFQNNTTSNTNTAIPVNGDSKIELPQKIYSPKWEGDEHNSKDGKHAKWYDKSEELWDSEHNWNDDYKHNSDNGYNHNWDNDYDQIWKIGYYNNHSHGHGHNWNNGHGHGHGHNWNNGHGHGHSHNWNNGHGHGHGHNWNNGHGHGHGHNWNNGHGHGHKWNNDHGHGHNWNNDHGYSYGHKWNNGYGYGHGHDWNNGHGHGHGHHSNNGHGHGHHSNNGHGHGHHSNNNHGHSHHSNNGHGFNWDADYISTPQKYYGDDYGYEEAILLDQQSPKIIYGHNRNGKYRKIIPNTSWYHKNEHDKYKWDNNINKVSETFMGGSSGTSSEIPNIVAGLQTVTTSNENSRKELGDNGGKQFDSSNPSETRLVSDENHMGYDLTTSNMGNTVGVSAPLNIGNNRLNTSINIGKKTKHKVLHDGGKKKNEDEKISLTENKGSSIGDKTDSPSEDDLSNDSTKENNSINDDSTKENNSINDDSTKENNSINDDSTKENNSINDDISDSDLPNNSDKSESEDTDTNSVSEEGNEISKDSDKNQNSRESQDGTIYSGTDKNDNINAHVDEHLNDSAKHFVQIVPDKIKKTNNDKASKNDKVNVKPIPSLSGNSKESTKIEQSPNASTSKTNNNTVSKLPPVNTTSIPPSSNNHNNSKVQLLNMDNVQGGTAYDDKKYVYIKYDSVGRPVVINRPAEKEYVPLDTSSLDSTARLQNDQHPPSKINMYEPVTIGSNEVNPPITHPNSAGNDSKFYINPDISTQAPVSSSPIPQHFQAVNHVTNDNIYITNPYKPISSNYNGTRDLDINAVSGGRRSEPHRNSNDLAQAVPSSPSLSKTSQPPVPLARDGVMVPTRTQTGDPGRSNEFQLSSSSTYTNSPISYYNNARPSNSIVPPSINDKVRPTSQSVVEAPSSNSFTSEEISNTGNHNNSNSAKIGSIRVQNLEHGNNKGVESSPSTQYNYAVIGHPTSYSTSPLYTWSKSTVSYGDSYPRQSAASDQTNTISLHSSVYKNSNNPKLVKAGPSTPRASLKRFDDSFIRQWHIINRGLEGGRYRGNDLNIIPTWKMGYNGNGINIAIIDSGFDIRHDDLAHKFDAMGSLSLVSGEVFELQNKLDNHGTRNAGLIFADYTGGCSVGIAFGSRMSVIVVPLKNMNEYHESISFSHMRDVNSIYVISWGPQDDGGTISRPKRMSERALRYGVEKGRRGLGSIYVIAAGNGALNGDNCNFDGYVNSPYTLAIGAITNRNVKANYSEECSSLLAVTYSGGGDQDIRTTDTNNGCTREHTGTSASAPMAAGVISLMLSARPDLSWRDIQQIIADNASKVDPLDKGWRYNAAGRSYNNKYGFGSLDTYRLVRAALYHANIPEALPPIEMPSLIENDHQMNNSPDSSSIYSEINIKKGDLNGIESAESVHVTINFAHKRRRRLNVDLVSPYGTISNLGVPRKSDSSEKGFHGWTFSTMSTWGENPEGTWKLIITETIDYDDPEPRIPITLGDYPLQWKIIVRGTCSRNNAYFDGAKLICSGAKPQNVRNLHTSVDKIFWISFGVTVSLLAICLLMILFKHKIFSRRQVMN